MIKNTVRRVLLTRLRLCTLACFVQFAVINDGYTYFLNGVQPAQPSSSLQSVFELTLEFHKQLAFGGSLSVVTGVHSAITRATLASMDWIRRIIENGFTPSQAARKSMLSLLSADSAGAYAEGGGLEVKRENYIGGKKESWFNKKESWNKFDAQSLENLQVLPFTGWDDPFVDDVIRAAVSALSREPGRDKTNFTRKLHFGAEDEPAVSSSQLPSDTDGKKSPGSSNAGWLFYYGSFFEAVGGLK